MAKNYKDLYDYTGDSIALEQRWYAVIEATKGQLTGPSDADFFFTLGGGSISFSQPFESSPHRSGRHHTSVIRKKKELTWSLSTYFNIDEALGAASAAEIDPAIRLLFRSVFGKEDLTGGSPVYNSSTAPDITFSLFEVGDKWARQARACFVQGCTMNFPGNGEATLEWSGAGAESVMCGIAKTETDNNTGNTITLLAGEGDRIPVNSLIMLIEADGVTRSADTVGGTWRKVVSKAGDVLTVDGAVLADADGSGADLYVSYYEPENPTAINNPVTGLVGTFDIASSSYDCLRSGSLSIANDHELVNYCYGSDSLESPFFVPGSRMTATWSQEINLNDEILELFNRLNGPTFETQDIQVILGDAAGRHFKLDIDKIEFPVPAFALPDTGSIPITFEGTAEQSALDAADEVIASFL